MKDPDGIVRLLRASLQLLSSSAPDQLLYLRSDGVPADVDELALELDDIEPLVPQLVERNLISRRAAKRISEVSELLSAMTGKAALWTPEALENSEIWSDVRKRAALALQMLTS
jgi:hypothetical protein